MPGVKTKHEHWKHGTTFCLAFQREDDNSNSILFNCTEFDLHLDVCNRWRIWTIIFRYWNLLIVIFAIHVIYLLQFWITICFIEIHSKSTSYSNTWIQFHFMINLCFFLFITIKWWIMWRWMPLIERFFSLTIQLMLTCAIANTHIYI